MHMNSFKGLQQTHKGGELAAEHETVETQPKDVSRNCRCNEAPSESADIQSTGRFVQPPVQESQSDVTPGTAG